MVEQSWRVVVIVGLLFAFERFQKTRRDHASIASFPERHDSFLVTLLLRKVP